MYYSYAEKKGPLFMGWSMREIAFDCSHRYLYYSEEAKEHQIVPCSGPPIISTDIGLVHSNTSVGSNENSNSSLQSPMHYSPNLRLPTRSPMSFPTAPRSPHDPHDILWKAKIKVDGLSCAAHTHEYKVYDPHLKEYDFYQMEIYGERRPIAHEEIPPPEPLLCPSSGLAGMPGRCTLDNEEFIRDPFFQRELFESLKTLFMNIRIDQETAAAREGRTLPREKGEIRTLQSPKKNTAAAPGNGDRVAIQLRFRTEYEFRRFLYVIKTVLGYDKLTIRPYRGFPPYDPRNGIILAHIPLYKWHTFKNLQKSPIYSFVRGDLMGRSADNRRTITLLKGGFLCVSHDTAMVLRDEGGAYCEVRLQHVEHFRYNYSCPQPYLAFISDVGHTDVIFVPSPPLFGHDSISRFNAREEVIRVHRIVHETCFCSQDIRRVIQIQEVEARSVQRFVDELIAEFEAVRVDLLDPQAHYSVADVHLPAVWEQAQENTRRLRTRSTQSETAIPLYGNHTNQVLTTEQLEALQRRLEAEPRPPNEIVGISLQEAEQLAVTDRGNYPRALSRRSLETFSILSDTTAAEDDLPPYADENACYISLGKLPDDVVPEETPQ
eukprot:gene1673-1038_t